MIEAALLAIGAEVLVPFVLFWVVLIFLIYLILR
jgi:phage terminase small subunit